jgi:WD40 repeat protein
VRPGTAPAAISSARLASGSEDMTVKVWDAQTGRQLLNFKAYTRALGVRSLTFSPDGKRLATANEAPGNAVKLWDGGHS